MLNSVVAKTTAQATFLSKMLCAGGVPQGARQFSVAFNVRSKFEEAYHKKMDTTKVAPKKE